MVTELCPRILTTVSYPWRLGCWLRLASSISDPGSLWIVHQQLFCSCTLRPLNDRSRPPNSDLLTVLPARAHAGQPRLWDQHLVVELWQAPAPGCGTFADPYTFHVPSVENLMYSADELSQLIHWWAIGRKEPDAPTPTHLFHAYLWSSLSTFAWDRR